MDHLLENDTLSVQIQLPQEHYNRTRYDWTGMITNVKFRGNIISGFERSVQTLSDGLGQGFYNEFGIKTPVGYDDILPGEWFHKIGVGLLQRDNAPYNFLKDYKVKPAYFSVDVIETGLRVTCRGPLTNGYAYTLVKEISLRESGFEIHYALFNKGNKRIITTEYNHNFLSTAPTFNAQDYQLSYPFVLDESVLEENINPEGIVEFNEQHISFKGSPTLDFFFSDLTGGKKVPAKWTLHNRSTGISISETGDFSTSAVHLWGAGHVISPELYFNLDILPGYSMRWTRSYDIKCLS